MRFLIQKCSKQVRHDFAFTLLEAIHFNDWLLDREKITVKFINTEFDPVQKVFTKLEFKPIYEKYVPVGSIEFVTAFLQHFYGLTPKPQNIPKELLRPEFLQRFVFNGTEKEIEGEKFVKSNDRIKSYTEFVNDKTDVPEGNYQISDIVPIESEWRAFVFRNKLRGLECYSGDFTMFPDVEQIERMIRVYAPNAPIAYTLDVGINGEAAIELEVDDYNDSWNTFIIEVHDFFSCGLYGFAELNLLPQMLHSWFWQYIQKEMYESRQNQ
jgi:hypothetical protein